MLLFYFAAKYRAKAKLISREVEYKDEYLDLLLLVV